MTQCLWHRGAAAYILKYSDTTGCRNIKKIDSDTESQLSGKCTEKYRSLIIRR